MILGAFHIKVGITNGSKIPTEELTAQKTIHFEKLFVLMSHLHHPWFYLPLTILYNKKYSHIINVKYHVIILHFLQKPNDKLCKRNLTTYKYNL